MGFPKSTPNTSLWFGCVRIVSNSSAWWLPTHLDPQCRNQINPIIETHHTVHRSS